MRSARMQSLIRHLMGWVKDVREQKGGALPPSGEFVDLDHLVNEMRLIKSAAEVRLMRRAAEISARGPLPRHENQPAWAVMSTSCRPRLSTNLCRLALQSPAYTSIVGGGKNGCILHYIENRDRLKAGDLVLIDAGCEYQDYAADISRTFPVNGRFTAAQAAIYDVVLAAQTAAIALIGPGLEYNLANEATIRVITQGLVDLGILEGSVETLIAEGGYRDFYMHSAGHWLGMDVHDVGDYKIDRSVASL